MCNFQWSGSATPHRNTKTRMWALQSPVRFIKRCPITILVSTPPLLPPSFSRVHATPLFFNPFLGPYQLDLISSTPTVVFPMSCFTCSSRLVQYKEVNAPPFKWDNFFALPCCSPTSPVTFHLSDRVFKCHLHNFSPRFKLRNQLKIHLEYFTSKQLSQNPKWPISDPSSKPTLPWSPSTLPPACHVAGPFSPSFHFLDDNRLCTAAKTF